MIPIVVRNAIANTETGAADLLSHLALVAAKLPLTQRWCLTLAEDRKELAEEIALVDAPPGSSILDICRRWAQRAPAKTVEEIKALLKKKDDVPVPKPLNAYTILTLDPTLRDTIRWNDYKKTIEIRKGPLSKQANIESVVTKAQNWMETRYGVTFSRSDLGWEIVLVAEQNSFNPLHDYLFGLKWDGISRIDMFFITYFGAEDTPHNRLISRRWLLGCISRALPHETWCTADGKEMGSKFDNIAILEGAQSEKKTSAWEVLGGLFYCSSTVTVGDKDSKMLAAASWFVESSELASFNKAETEPVKAFATMRTDTYRAPYGKGIIHTPRHCVNTGSTNKKQYLPDDTGNRRYWCIAVQALDLVGLMRDRDQIWAEAVALFLEEMECPVCEASTDTVAGQRPRCARHRWWLDKAEEADAAAEVAKREEDQPWMFWSTKIEKWWRQMPKKLRPTSITAGEIAEVVGGLQSTDRVTPAVLTAIGIAMPRIGFLRVPSKRCYVPTEAALNVQHEPDASAYAPGKRCTCEDCKPSSEPPPIPGNVLQFAPQASR